MLRRPSTARSRLHCIEDALEVVASVLATEPDTTAMVLVDRRPPHDGLVACYAGPFELADLDRLDRCVLEATTLAEPGCRMVLVSRTDPDGRPCSDGVDEASLELWHSMQARHHAGPVPLLDWLVVDEGTVVSYAELAGPRVRWRPH